MSVLMDLGDLKVSVKMINSGSVRARATLTYHGIEIHGFTISNSDRMDKDVGEFVYIQPPRQKVGDKWVNIVYFSDEEQWGEVKKVIYSHYYSPMVNSTSPNSINDLNLPKKSSQPSIDSLPDKPNINDEEIPF